MPGLEKLLVGLYGTTPQIDLDKQLARVRVPRPTAFDFAGLGEGYKRNNVDLGRIWITVSADVADGKVTFRPTGQTFPFRGAPPPGPGPQRLKFHVLDWRDAAKTALELAR